jgi:PKD repeat protein
MFNALNNCLDTYYDLVIVIDSTKNLCQAGFTNYAINTTVTFTDQSTGEITDYFWDFGDGFYSVDANTTHTYASPGYYEVMQTVFNSTDNCMDDFSKVVKVVDTTAVMCKADFNFYPNGNTVSFTSQATGAFKQVFWDFGNGKISNNANPVHTYSKPGYYNVAYTVVDTNTTCFDTKYKVVYVEGTITPTYGEVSAAFSHYPASDSLTVFFTDNSKGNVSNWYWDFGDNTPASKYANPNHKYTVSDYYRVCQTVSNPESQNTQCKFIAVGDVSTKNTAFFTYYADTLYATAYFQNKSLGDIVSYFWDFGDYVTSTQKNPAHTYADTGYYAVCLTTTSSTGRNRTYCKDVRIGNSIDNPCLFSCVWPGDANSDLEANHYDMLTIGLNYGMEGPFRVDASNAWYGQFAQNWSTYQINGTNNKHGDCNGDGVINELDTVAISQNFAYSHYEQPDTKAAEWELTCVWDPEDTKAAGSRSRAKAILSPPLKKAAGDIYGIGYEIEVLNAQGVIWDSVYVSFDESWLGEEGTDMMTFYTVNREKSMIYVSSVRKDHQNTTGAGSIATVHFTLEEGYSARSISFNVTTEGGIEAGGLAVGVGGGIMLNLGDDVSICEGEETTISAPEGFETYAWSSGESTRSITVSAQGTYTLTVTDSLGTVASDAITLNVIANPVPVLGDDITTDTEVVLNTGGTFETYLWSTDETTPTITVTQSGKYWVEVSNSFGCTGSDTVYVSFVGINDYISQMETMTIHPNPNQGSFWLITENEMFGELRYELIDLQGKVILNKELPVKGKVRHLVHPEYLPQGMYYLKSYYNDEVKIIKVVVQ